MRKRISAFWDVYARDIAIAACAAMFVVTAFGIIRLTAPMPKKGEISVTNLPVGASVSGIVPDGGGQQAGNIVASKSGTKYYRIGCSRVNRIKPENLIHFSNEAEALAAGYTPAQNCPGLGGR